MEHRSRDKAFWTMAIIIFLALVGGLIVYALSTQNDSNDKSASETTTQDSTNQTEQPAASADETRTIAIVYTDEGFSPSKYTVKAGQQVEVRNESSHQLQFSSDDHPIHTDQPELNLSVIEPGETVTFTPTKPGEWGFHDHLNDEFTGTLRVTE